MEEYLFQKEKADILSKKDKSKKGSIDEKIKPLMGLINNKKEYFTTSSCSGRVKILKPKLIKKNTEWFLNYHDLINKNKINELYSLQEKGRWLRAEGPIIHIRAVNIEKANLLADVFRKSGWKKTSIKRTSPNIIIEAKTSQVIYLPFENLSKKYIEKLTEEINTNLKKGWLLIERVSKELKK
ncbi:hypothetical protein JW949_01710 [Candidatus Woesearchaeota archaeon]|nr:hypothetical protein [Candidatus Woesearchaeota archaeon]